MTEEGATRTKQSILEMLEQRPHELFDQNSYMDLASTDNISVEQAFKDFRREKILFNGVPFIPQGEADDDASNTFVYSLFNFVDRMIRIDPSCATVDDQFMSPLSPSNTPVSSCRIQPIRPSSSSLFNDEALEALSELSINSPTSPSSTASSSANGSRSADLAQILKDRRNKAEILSSTILRNACRTGAGADSFFNTQRIFVLDGTFLTHKSGSHEGNGDIDAPVKIDVVLVPCNGGSSSDNDTDLASLSSNYSTMESKPQHSLVAIAEIWNSFTLFDMSSMDSAEQGDDSSMVPWLEIDTIIIDETNLRTKERSRKMDIVVYHPESKKYLYPTHMTEDMLRSTFWDYLGDSDTGSCVTHNSCSDTITIGKSLAVDGDDKGESIDGSTSRVRSENITLSRRLKNIFSFSSSTS